MNLHQRLYLQLERILSNLPAAKSSPVFLQTANTHFVFTAYFERCCKMLAKTGAFLMGGVSSSPIKAASTTTVMRSQFRSLPCTSTIPADQLMMLAIRQPHVLEEYCVAGAAATGNSKDINLQTEPSNAADIENTTPDVIANEPEQRRKSLKDSVATIIGAGGE